MSQTRRAAARAVEAATHMVGRHQVVRAARFALNQARLDGPNNPTGNGEHALQQWVLASIPTAEPVTVFDVGAHVGDWSQAMLDHARLAGHAHNLSLHAFEPASHTYDLLAARLPRHARTHRLAMSSGVGQTTLHVTRPGAGSNSLHRSATHASAGLAEPVRTTTVDEYVRGNGIGHIDLLKVDAEGHDFPVLLGAEQTLRAGAVSVVQFEYNHRWVQARHFLKDVFDLVAPMGYRVGKLTARGAEPYPAWDPDLESFVEGNYLAYTQRMGSHLPHIKWWKSQF